ncbi:hypothetical protein MMB232_00412 [Brevundimonas subvibrioides]|uniref:DUF2306 domain-containing protein n=1 Tax=Brevundimonas subvibrioides TaxID=74313 RepID=UPI0032D5992E
MTHRIPTQGPLRQTLTFGPPLIAAAVLAWLLLVLAPGWGLPVRLHAPDWALLAEQAPVLQVHIGAATLALGIGVVLLAGVKGNALHRTLGWTWAAAMTTVAFSSLFIRSTNPGSFSWIHLLTGWTLIILPMALYAARTHDVGAHRSRMTGLLVGALLIAGMFTFFPGRLMWRVFLG